jgi:hypothetical protein
MAGKTELLSEGLVPVPACLPQIPHRITASNRSIRFKYMKKYVLNTLRRMDFSSYYRSRDSGPV